MNLPIFSCDLFELVLADEKFRIEVVFFPHKEEIIVDISGYSICFADCRTRLRELSLIGQVRLGLIDLWSY